MTGNEQNNTNPYLEDLQQMRQLCENYDFDDAASNKRLHRYLKDKKIFSTWIGRNFLIGLGNRSHSSGYRETLQKCLRILGVSFLVLAVIVVAALGYTRVQEVKQKAVLDYIRKEREIAAARPEEPENETSTEEPEEAAEPKVLKEYEAFVGMYPNVVGWLKVDGTPIDYPVMQDKKDEDFYLKHNFEGESDSKGALFVDKDSEIFPQDTNIVIFGHNMRNNSIFGSLDEYLDRDFYKKYNKIEFDTIYEKAQYRIAAVIKTAVKKEREDGFRYYWFHNYASEEEYEEFMKFVEQNQVYDTGESITFEDTMIMLSTCEYSVDNGRLVVIAKKIKD